MNLTIKMIDRYICNLKEEERSEATIKKYRRDLTLFYDFLPDGKILDKNAVLSWKERLISLGYASSSVNVMLASVNGMLAHAGLSEWRAKFLKRQRSAFREERRELGRSEYMKLVETARREKKERIGLAMETICSTGIRVSELAFITVEAARGMRRAEAQRQMPPHTLPRRSRKKAPALRRLAENGARPDIPRQKREAVEPPQRMVGDEEDRQKSRRRGEQSIPAQPPPPLRQSVLFARTRPIQTRGPARAQQHRNDAHIHSNGRLRTSAPAQ